MARILGVDIPRNKAMFIAMRSLYGVGPQIAKEVLTKADIDLVMGLLHGTSFLPPKT